MHTNKLRQISKISVIILVPLFVMFLMPNEVKANPFQEVALAATEATLLPPVNALLGFFKDALNGILTNAITPIVSAVMGFNNFFTDGVNKGWEVTRNFANLFFALILLLIAIATVLNVGPLDNYTAKRTLPIFISVALLINFSKAIVGFLIDISQIIMIELWNAIGQNGISEAVNKASNIGKAANASGFQLLALNLVIIIMIIVFIAVFLWTAVILITRIANLWIAILLSPLAFMSFLIPGLRELYNTWVKLLQSALVTGPVLMFMLYLSVVVMNNGFPAMPDKSQNILEQGYLFTYILVVILLFASNALATKAGAEAPPLLQKAVAVGTTLATFGAAKYVGAGGYGTGKLLKTSREYGDKTLGGLTNITGQNAKYEAAKKDFKDRQASGTGIFGKDTPLKQYNPLRLARGFSEEGKKQQLQEYEVKYANELYASGKLEDKANERYKKIFNSNQATAASEVKGVENVDKLIEDLNQALEDGDKAMAMALSSRISELKGWSKVFAENSKFSQYGKDYDSEGEQLTAFINDNFGRDNNGNEIQDNKILNDFKSRQVSILRSKGADNFTVGLTPETQSSPTVKAAKAGVIGAGAIYAKNNNIFNTRSKASDNSREFKDGKAKYDFNINEFAPVIGNESSYQILEDPKSWNQYSDIKNTIIKGIQEYLNADNATRQDPKYSNIYGEIDDNKLKSALKGLGASASSRVTGSSS